MGTQESSLGKEGQLFRRRHKENLKMKHLLLLSMATLASCAPQSLVVTTTSLQCNSDEEGCIEVKTIPASSSLSTTSTTTIPTTTITTTSTTTTTLSTTTEKQVATKPLETTKFHIKSEIQFRYARTVVESTVSNPDTVAQVGSFALVIPDSAFISAISSPTSSSTYSSTPPSTTSGRPSSSTISWSTSSSAPLSTTSGRPSSSTPLSTTSGRQGRRCGRCGQWSSTTPRWSSTSRRPYYG